MAKTERINLGSKGSMTIKKGALHEELGVPSGDKIPESKLDRAGALVEPDIAQACGSGPDNEKLA